MRNTKQKYRYEMSGVKLEIIQCVKDLGVTINFLQESVAHLDYLKKVSEASILT